MFDDVVRIAEQHGLAFIHHPSAHEKVITCGEAARVRGISLRQELKSLVLQTSIGIAVASIPGDMHLHLRAVKQLLGTKQAYLASEAAVSDLGLSRGTICPLLPILWDYPQLIDNTVLHEELVYTNDGTLIGYVAFSPRLLLEAPIASVGHLSRPSVRRLQ